MNRKLKLTELNRLNIEQFKEKTKMPLVVVLDNIRSHHNVGSIFRTADAFPVEAVYLCGYTPVPPHREIQKTALGATDSVNWKHFENTQQALDELKAEGYQVIAIEQTEKTSLLQDFPISKTEKYALIFGNEVGGIEQEIIDQCHAVIEVPQEGTKHSLNISVCGGVVLWEFFRNFH